MSWTTIKCSRPTNIKRDAAHVTATYRLFSSGTGRVLEFYLNLSLHSILCMMLFTFNVSLYLLLTVVLGFTDLSFASLRFLRGRPRGGMLVAPASKHENLPEAHWFTQRLNHFDDSNTKTWQQRFFYNDTFHKKPDGPVFVMIGGEGEANPIWLVVGNMMKNAEKFGAFTFLLEHRFYGESRPTR